MNNLQANSVVNQVAKVAVICLLVAITACSNNLAPDRIDPEGEAALLARVTERWKAMEKKDFATTYNYATPNYQRVFSKALYLNKFSYSIDWQLTGVEVLNYDARAAVASVAVRVMSKPAKQTASASIFGATPFTLRESWVFVDGLWWHNAKE